MEFKLIKKQYLGRPSYRFFKNNETGEMLKVEITKEEYDKVEQQGDQPLMDGYTWAYSAENVIKIDNENGELEEGQYCDFEDGYYVLARNPDTGRLISQKVTKNQIINDILIWQ